jgi:hypothetical protein
MWLFWILILIVGIALLGAGFFIKTLLWIAIAVLVVWLLAVLLFRRRRS